MRVTEIERDDEYTRQSQSKYRQWRCVHPALWGAHWLTDNKLQSFAAWHWAITLMSAHGCNVKQLAFTPLDRWITSGQQLSMGSVSGWRHTFVPWLTIPEEAYYK
ncbi:hypothetical protein TNCV_1109761 [Trichonephila clavipes]|nr:hypothetical protein TNCV_1109761 [Trichonephila clavipes]